MQNTEKVQNHVRKIKSILPESFKPTVGLVLGTGLGGLASSLKEEKQISYKDLPEFPQSTVESHKGQFISGYLNNIPIILQQGRCHLYEGRSPEETVRGIRTMAALGIKVLIITNAAGSINPLFPAGELMLITDHINMTGESPLQGINNDELGPRFPDMSQVYNPELRNILSKKALELGLPLHKGIYIGVKGPELETPAETRAYRAMGADAIGMSTVMEAIAAKHMGLNILGISCLSNLNLPDCMAEASLDEIIKTSEQAGLRLSELIEASLPEIAEIF